MSGIVRVIINAFVSFIYLFIIGKILGKKQIAELDFIDYVVGISIGSIAAEMATDVDRPWYYFIIAMSVFAGLDLIIAMLGRKGNFFKKLLKGTPLILVKNGKIDFEELKKSKLDINDVIGLSRSIGYFDFNDIAFAILETNGTLSVLPKANQKPVVCEDLKIKPEKPSLTQNLIVDGNISDFALKYLEKDKTWLYKGANIKSKNELKNILLAVYNQDEDKLTLHLKKD